MDGRDPVSDLEILTDELAAYGDGDMLNRRSLVVANKMDLLNKNDQKEIIDGLVSVVEQAGIRMEGDIIGISAGVTGEGLPSLSNAMRDIVSLSEADNERQNAMN
jgi:GTPase involved in cell partitioning and DNA repair